MKNPLQTLPYPSTQLSRRALGTLALGATLSACGGGGDSSLGTLPVITGHPQNVFAVEGQEVRFSVVANEVGQLRYQWLRNGVAIAQATDHTLVLRNIGLADHGALFSVVVTNPAGSVQSGSAVLEVRAKTKEWGTVVASDWSRELPRNYGALIEVGSSGWVYVYDREKHNLLRYKTDASVTEGYDLSRIAISVYGASDLRINVKEDASSGDILIARAWFTGASINISTAIGGGVYRINPGSGQVTTLVEPDTIVPSGLALDRFGNLYTIDLKTRNVLKIAADSHHVSVIYENKRAVGNAAQYPFTAPRGMVAVTDDGTVYATIESSYPSPLFLDDSVSGRSLLRLRDNQADAISISHLPATWGSVAGWGAYGNDLVFLLKSSNFLVCVIDVAGNVRTVAGTPGSTGPTQFGSPGILSDTSRWIGMTPDGRVHLDSQAAEGSEFFDVILPD